MDGTATMTTIARVAHNMEGVPYRATIAPRNLAISRTSCTSPAIINIGNARGAGSTGVKRSYVCSINSVVPVNVCSIGVGAEDVKSATEREKNEMRVFSAKLRINQHLVYACLPLFTVQTCDGF